MDGYTPISQLRPEMQQRPQNNDNDNILSYQDVLKNLDKQEPQSSNINEAQILDKSTNQIPVYPQYQQNDNTISSTPIASTIPKKKSKSRRKKYYKDEIDDDINVYDDYDLFSDNIQQDIALIMAIYVLLHSEFSQKFIQEKFPNMYVDNSMTMFGIISHGFMLTVVLYIGKYIKNKYYT